MCLSNLSRMFQVFPDLTSRSLKSFSTTNSVHTPPNHSAKRILPSFRAPRVNYHQDRPLTVSVLPIWICGSIKQNIREIFNSIGSSHLYVSGDPSSEAHYLLQMVLGAAAERMRTIMSSGKYWKARDTESLGDHRIRLSKQIPVNL